MSKSTTLIVLGVLVFLSPFIGLPTSWLSWLLPIFGIIVGIIGYLIRIPRAAPIVSALEQAPESVPVIPEVAPASEIEPSPTL